MQLQIVEKIKCRHTPFLEDMSPFITYVFPKAISKTKELFAAFVALPAIAVHSKLNVRMKMNEAQAVCRPRG